jgi:sugar lactone lactonase YvrE
MAMRRGIIGLVVVFALAFPAGAAAFGPVSSFGSWGEGPGQFRPEGGIAIGPNSHTYVADYLNGRVDEFGADGSFVRFFGSLTEPEGIAVAANGEVYAADLGGDRVVVYSAEGAFLREFGTTGEGAGQMTEPSGLAFDPASGNLFVSDKGLARIDVFTPGGSFVRAFGKEVNPSGGDVCTTETGCKKGLTGQQAGRVIRVRGIAFSPSNGRLYLADELNQRIDVFTPQGEFLFAFGKGVKGAGGGEGDLCTEVTACHAGIEEPVAGAIGDPLWLVFDREGNLNVSTIVNHRIDVFSASGEFLRAFGEGVVDGQPVFQTCTSVCQEGLINSAPRSGSLMTPEGLAIDCGGSLEVLEVEDNAVDNFARIERFGEFTAPVPPCEEKEPVRVILRKTTTPRLRISIHLNRKRGTATALIRTGGTTGSLKLRGPHVHHVFRRQVTSPRCLPDHGCHLVHLVIRATGKAKKQLDETGAANVHFAITFNPAGSAPLTKARDLTLRKR